MARALVELCRVVPVATQGWVYLLVVAAALQLRGVTVVHDFGETDGVLFLVMELLEGRNLSQLLEDNQHRPLPGQARTHVAHLAPAHGVRLPGQ